MAFSHAVSLDEALQKLKQKYSPCYEFAHLLQYSWYHSAQVFIWWFEKFWYLNQDTNIGCTFSAFQTDIGTGFQELNKWAVNNHYLQSSFFQPAMPLLKKLQCQRYHLVFLWKFLCQERAWRSLGVFIPGEGEGIRPSRTLAGLSNSPSDISGFLLQLSLSQVLRFHIPSKLL